MSCNGCRVLRKGCSDSCMLRHCLSGVDGPEAQGHATLFLAKFYGRAGLMGFISAVEESQRPGPTPALALANRHAMGACHGLTGVTGQAHKAHQVHSRRSLAFRVCQEISL